MREVTARSLRLSFGLLILYVVTHVPMLADVWRYTFPSEDHTISQEIVVTPGGDKAASNVSPETFDRVAADPANSYFQRTNWIQTDQLPLGLFSENDRVLLLEGNQSLRHSWKRPVVWLARTRLHSGRSASRLVTRSLLDDAGLKILHAPSRSLVVVFYDSPQTFEKAWTYLTWLRFHRQHDDLKYTFEPAPLCDMFDDKQPGKLRTPNKIGTGSRIGAEKRGNLGDARVPVPVLLGPLSRFLCGKSLTLYVQDSLEATSPEICFGSAHVGSGLSLTCDPVLAARFPEMSFDVLSGGELTLRGGDSSSIGQFTHYVYGTDGSIFLLGTFESPGLSRAYLVVRCGEPESTPRQGAKSRR
jgi:hypothetical protein